MYGFLSGTTASLAWIPGIEQIITFSPAATFAGIGEVCLFKRGVVLGGRFIGVGGRRAVAARR